MSLGTIVLIILVIALLGGFSGIGGGPFYGTGYYGGGGLGLLLVIVLIWSCLAGFERLIPQPGKHQRCQRPTGRAPSFRVLPGRLPQQRPFSFRAPRQRRNQPRDRKLKEYLPGEIVVSARKARSWIY
jgi:hypothetical protein